LDSVGCSFVCICGAVRGREGGFDEVSVNGVTGIEDDT